MRFLFLILTQISDKSRWSRDLQTGLFDEFNKAVSILNTTRWIDSRHRLCSLPVLIVVLSRRHEQPVVRTDEWDVEHMHIFTQ